MLDDKRRELQRASDGRGRPLEFSPHTSEYGLERVINALGDGLYRLVARDRAGKILARRDFAAAMWSVPDVHQRGHAPRTEIEELKAQLNEARKATEEAAAEQDAARAEVEASKQAVAERDAEICSTWSAATSRSGPVIPRRVMSPSPGATRDRPPKAARHFVARRLRNRWSALRYAVAS